MERQKLILLADKSEFGWKTVDEYTQHDLADDERDGKKIRHVEERAEKAVKSSTSKKSTKKQGVFSRFSNFPANSRSAFTSPQFQGGSSSLVPWRNQSSAFIRSSERPSSRQGTDYFACDKFGHWRSEFHQRGASSKAQSDNR